MICKYYPLSICCLFALMIMLPEVQKFLILISNVFTFSFVAYAFSIICKNPLPNPRSQRLTPLTSLKNFIVSALIFRSFITFS